MAIKVQRTSLATHKNTLGIGQGLFNTGNEKTKRRLELTIRKPPTRRLVEGPNVTGNFRAKEAA